MAGNGKWTRIEDVFPIENGDFPASYVSLLEGTSTQMVFIETSQLCQFFSEGHSLVLQIQVRCLGTARSWRLPASATPLVSECGKCSVDIGISVSLPVYVPH